MTHVASTVLAMGDDADARALQQALQGSGYIAPFFTDGEQALEKARASAPDLIIVGPGLQGRSGDAFVTACGTDPQLAVIPLVVLTAEPLAAVGDHLLAARVDDAIAWPSDPAEVVQRLRPTVRLSTMREELAIRRTVSGTKSTPEDVVSDQDTPPTIMVIGGPDAEKAVSAALKGKARLTRNDDLFEAQRLLEEQRFDACVIAAGEQVEPALDLCLQIRRNPRLFNLPVVFVSDADHLGNLGRALNMGASHVIATPAAETELRFSLMTLVRRQRLRWLIRQDLACTLDGENRAARVKEAYSAGFLERYLDQRIAQAKKTQRQFSVVGFAFAGVDAIRHEFGPQAEGHLLDQIGQWLTLLVRAEDMVAHLDGARFCVTLPDTPPNEAQVVMHRIAGVISNTDFAVADVYRVVTVWPYVHAFGLTDADRARTILDALSSLDASDLDFG
jgi:two-component system cell cycle response regulator